MSLDLEHLAYYFKKKKLGPGIIFKKLLKLKYFIIKLLKIIEMWSKLTIPEERVGNASSDRQLNRVKFYRASINNISNRR